MAPGGRQPRSPVSTMNVNGTEAEQLPSDGGRLVNAIPSFSLARLVIPPEALRGLPADFVHRHRIIPLALRDGTLTIATASPGDRRLLEDIRLLSGLEVDEHLAGGSP